MRRGYGLHLTLAQQFPKQLIDQGDAGRRLYNSVMENARSKVVFQLSDEENLMPLAKWLYRGTFDPDEVKLRMYSKKVMDYQVEYRTIYSQSRSSSSGGGGTHTYTEGNTESGRIDQDAEAWSRHLSAGGSENSTWSESESEGVTETPMLMPILGHELSHVQFRSLEEQLDRSMAALSDQEQRQFVARLQGMKAPVSVFTPHVPDGYARDDEMNNYATKLLQRWPCAIEYAKALTKLAARQQLLVDSSMAAPSDEPATSGGRAQTW